MFPECAGGAAGPPWQGNNANSKFTPAPGGGAVDARLATLMPLTLIKVAFGVSVIFIKGTVG